MRNPQFYVSGKRPMYLMYIFIILMVYFDVITKPSMWNCVLHLHIDTTTLHGWTCPYFQDSIILVHDSAMHLSTHTVSQQSDGFMSLLCPTHVSWLVSRGFPNTQICFILSFTIWEEIQPSLSNQTQISRVRSNALRYSTKQLYIIQRAVCGSCHIWDPSQYQIPRHVQ